MFSRIARVLWGNLTEDELKKFGLLSVTFLFIIGSYWLMRVLKDALFMDIVGEAYIPRAKMLSVALLIPLIVIYSKLVDLCEKQKLFYVICSFYATLFLGITYFLAHPIHGLANTEASPDRILGWVIYLGVETFGSLVVALFWSFVASSVDTASAKRGYGLIIGGAQIGSIAGPTLATFAETIGLVNLLAIVSAGIFVVPFLIMLFVRKYPASPSLNVAGEKKNTGPLEGLKLLFSKPYLIGILGVATLYEVIGTIMDYQLKVTAKATYGSATKVASFLGTFGQCANGLALVFALVGTSFVIRRFGLTFCLVMFPLAVSSVILYVWWSPSLWTLFGAMVTIKGLSYALNNPCKEVMYIPTSKDVKFKAKGWIDAFGSRSAKASGSVITDAFRHSAADLMFFGSLISLGIVGIWIIAALYVGRRNEKLIKEGAIIQ